MIFFLLQVPVQRSDLRKLMRKRNLANIFFCKLDKNIKPLFALSFHFETLNLMAIREFWPFLKESLILLLEQLLEPVSYSREALRNSENYWIVSWFISTFANYTWSLRLRLSRQTCTYNFASNGSGSISRWTVLMCLKKLFLMVQRKNKQSSLVLNVLGVTVY